MINELPREYQTTVGERGVRLSGEQRKRIGIARALYHNPQVLILDEATSVLDDLTEQAVMEAVHRLGHEITIIPLYQFGYLSCNEAQRQKRKSILNVMIRMLHKFRRMFGLSEPLPNPDNNALANGFLNGCLRLQVSLGKKINIIQIGANDGFTNDPIHEFIESHANVSGVFIEPLPDVFERLCETYKNKPEFHFINAAVASVSRQGKSLQLWRIKPEYDEYYKGIMASGITSANREYVLKKAAQNLPANFGDPKLLIESIDPDTVELNDIARHYFKDQQVDLLQVDTEGMDDEIILSIDFRKWSPKMISFESIHIPQERLKNLLELLRLNLYRVYANGPQDMVAIRHDCNT